MFWVVSQRASSAAMWPLFFANSILIGACAALLSAWLQRRI
jgi:hypothetical protein